MAAAARSLRIPIGALLVALGGAVGVARLAPASLSAQQGDLLVIEAVRRRDEKALLALIRAKADVNAAQPDGATALSWAVHLGEHRMAEELLDAGARVDVADEYGETPLTLAAANGDAPIVGRLLEAGAPADHSRWNGESAIMIAAGAGNVDVVRMLVMHGVNVNAADPRRGQSALMWAAAEGHSAVVKTLLEVGAEARAVSKSGFTALAFAVVKDDVESVRLLLAAGLDPNYLLPSGNRLLLMAINRRRSASALALIDGGAEVQAVDRVGRSALHLAAETGDVNVVTALARHGSVVDARTPAMRLTVDRARDGGRIFAGGGQLTPLMLAAQANHIAVMRALVDAGADPSLRADSGATLLMFAAGGTLETVRYAYELDPHVDVVDELGQTPMHAAVGARVTRTQNEVCEVIQFLADKGAALDDLDAAGRTALSIADGPPIDQAVKLLTSLITASGQTPRIPSKR